MAVVGSNFAFINFCASDAVAMKPGVAVAAEGANFIVARGVKRTHVVSYYIALFYAKTNDKKFKIIKKFP